VRQRCGQCVEVLIEPTPSIGVDVENINPARCASGETNQRPTARVRTTSCALETVGSEGLLAMLQGKIGNCAKSIMAFASCDCATSASPRFVRAHRREGLTKPTK
jgi:hypothetical protein